MAQKRLLFPAYVVIIGIITVVSLLKPSYNWDILPYIASAYSLETGDTLLIHSKTYDALKNSTDKATFELLTSSNKYRESMFTCAACFVQQLPFYKIRPLYIILIFILYKLNIGILQATVVISAVSYFLLCILIYLWLANVFKEPLAGSIISLLISFSPFLIVSSSDSTPNLLSALIIFSALYLLVNNKFIWFCFMMILSVFSRPDNIIFLLVITFTLLLYKGENFRVNKKTLIYLSAAGLICFYIIDKWAGNYGWGMMFEHSFKERIILPASYQPQFTPALYFEGIRKWLFLFKFSILPVPLFLLAVTIFLRRENLPRIKSDISLLLLFAALASIVIHYIIYPVMDDKYFIAQYLLTDIIFLQTIFQKSVARGWK